MLPHKNSVHINESRVHIDERMKLLGLHGSLIIYCLFTRLLFIQHVEPLNANMKGLHMLLKTQTWTVHGTTFNRKTRVTAAVKSVLRLVGALFMHAVGIVRDLVRLKVGSRCEGSVIANSTRVFRMHVAGCVLVPCHLERCFGLPLRTIVILFCIIDV